MDNLDPDLDLQESRARNDLRLKSTFEAIFRKYEHDFTGIGDEIDLRTGEIVVDNGHIQDMRSEHDIGDRNLGPTEDFRAFTTTVGKETKPRKTSSLLSDDFDRLSHCEVEKVKACAHIGVRSDNDDVDSLLGPEQDPDVPVEQGPQMEDIWSAGDGIKDTTSGQNSAVLQGLPSQQALLSQFGPTLGIQFADLVSKIRNPNLAVEEAWRAPDLPAAPPIQRPILKSLVNMGRERSVSPLNQASIWATPRSTGRPKKGGSAVLSKRTLTGNNTFIARPEASVPDNAHVDPRKNYQVKAVFGDDSNSRSSERELHDPQCGHLPLPRENGLDFHTIEDSNTAGYHQIPPRLVNRNASYNTPKPLPSRYPNTLRNSQGSSLKRKRPQQNKQSTETLNERGQSFEKQDIEHHTTSRENTTHHFRADCQTLVSPRPNQSPRSQRKQLTYCARWTLPEEELLWHLKETTDLGYSQLVEYFPGRTNGSIREHYRVMASSSKLKPGNSKTSLRPLYTPQEDELLVELRSNKGLPWKDITSSFPTRTTHALAQRHWKLLQVTPPSMEQATSPESSSTTSEDVLHIGSAKTSLACAPSEQKDLPSTESLHGEHLTLSSPQRTEVDLRTLCEVTDKAQPLVPSTTMENTPLRDQTPKLVPPSSAAFKVVIQTSTSNQRQHIEHGESVTTTMATPDVDYRLRRQTKDISVGRTDPLKGDTSVRSKASHKEIDQPRTSTSTSTASKKLKVRKSRISQAAGTKASPKTLTPRSKAALISLLGDGTDDEDELSMSAIVLGNSEDLPLTTPNRTIGQGCVGGKGCDRKFCFKCT